MKCKHCHREAVFELRYSGHSICKRHFVELFERRVKKTIRQNKLLAKDDYVVVALSGGEGSMSVLRILHDILGRNPRCRLTAVTVDEGSGDKSLKRLREYCESLGVGYDTISHSNKGETRGVEGLALKLRLINDYAKEMGASKVALGSNLDDEIQAAFVNMAAGELTRIGVESAGGGHVPLVKILRECPQEEVLFYAKVMELPYERGEHTPSGSLQATVRELLDSLEEKHPGSKYQMLRSIDEFAHVMGKQKGKGDEASDSRRANPGRPLI